MTTAKRPNFFILLGLDPDATWNQAHYETALRQRRNEWARAGAGVARQALAAQQNRAYIPEIERIMNPTPPTNTAERDNEAKEARVELASGRRARHEQFEKQLAFINAKDPIEEAEINKFVEDFKDILTAKEIEDRIVVSVKSAGTSSATKQKLGDTEAKNIANHLQRLHLKSLYELLQCLDPTTPNLRMAAEKLYTDMVSLPPTAEVTAKSELAGMAKIVFASEDMRQRYDETLRQVPLERLLKELDEIINRAPRKEVSPGQRDLFLANAVKESWTEQEALEQLVEHAVKRKWFVPLPDGGPRLLCFYCEHFNDSKNLSCFNCKKSLFIECPRCGQQASLHFFACNNCGFPVGNLALVDSYLQEIKEELKKHDLQRIDILLQETEEVWPSSKNDEYTRKRIEFKRQVDTERKQQRDFIDILDQLIGQKKFFTARERLTKRKLPSFPDLATRRQTITNQIERAQKLIQIVLSGQKSHDERIELCRRALMLCVDYKEALELLDRMPPSRPGGLRASTHGTMVRLTWDASPTREVMYKVVRKSRVRPNALTDGTVLGTVTGLSYDDNAPEIGLPLYYAVFTALGTNISSDAAYNAQPVMVIQDATKFSCQVNNRSVTLSWEPPPHVYAIIIIRKEQSPPTSLTDGTRLSPVAPAQKRFEDTKVLNERTYYYGLYCQFKDTNGTLHTTTGMFIAATPEVPPVPIAAEDVSISETPLENGRKVHITWKVPKKGTTIVLKSPRLLHKEGQMVQEMELQALGERLEGQADGVIDIWTGFGVAYYTPVVIFQHTGYVGTSQRYACIENVRNLRARNTGSAIRLQWTWPQDCDEVFIAYDDAGYPNLTHPDTSRSLCNRTEYGHVGYYDIQGRTSQKYYIVVATVIEQDGEKIAALGMRVEATLQRQTELTYEIKISRFLRNKRTLHITTSNSKLLPALVLISKRDGIPMDQNDGDLFQRIEPPMMTKHELVVELSTHTLPPQTFGMLFLEDEDGFHHEFTIHHPHKNKLRLS